MAPAVYSRSFYSTRKKWLDDYAKLFGTKVTREWMDAFAELCRNFLTLDVTDRLSGIRVPTLVISVAEDILKPPSYGQILHHLVSDLIQSQSVQIEE